MSQAAATTLTLTPEQRDAFDRLGILRLDGLISAERIGRARDAVLGPLEQLGLWRDGGWHVEAVPRPQWPGHGLKTSKVIGNKRPELEALIEEPSLCEAVDALMNGRPANRAIYPRPQVLFSLPNADEWTLPPGWHVDCPRLASGETPGVQLFGFLDTVIPRGGGTSVIAGSQRLLNHGRFMRPKDMRRLMQREDFFRILYSEAPVGPDERLPKGAVGDVPLEVVELTGAPGDVWLVDLRVLHSASPNAADRPRLMFTHRYIRADLVGEMAEGYGWR
jgi:hypothetical protein